MCIQGYSTDCKHMCRSTCKLIVERFRNAIWHLIFRAKYNSTGLINACVSVIKHAITLQDDTFA